MAPQRSRLFSLTVSAALALLLAQCLWLYGHTGRDDAFLTYWPAVALGEHGSILNYNGERVEQSSTLLHTLSLAALHTLLPAVAVPTLAWAASLAAGLLALLATALALRARQTPAGSVLALAAAPSLVFWSSSGMETPASTALFTALLLIALQDVSSVRNRLLLASIAAMAVTCRPEAAFVLLAFVAGGWLLTRRQHGYWLTVLVATIVAFACITAWRHASFGSLFPQPVYAKSSGISAANLLKGLHYLLVGGDSLTTRILTATGLAASVIALGWLRHPQRHAILVAGALAAAQVAFILASGGDWMDATRFLLPVLPALLLCTALLLSPWPRLLHTTSALLLLVALHDSWQFAGRESTGFAATDRAAARAQYLGNVADLSRYSSTELQTKDALRDIPQLEHLRALAQTLLATEPTLQLASIQMGFIPYHLAREFYPRLQFLDLRALGTSQLTRCPHTRDFPRSDTGLKISYDEFLALLPELARDCGVRKPDILYDLGYGMRQDVLARNGYVITYREARTVRGQFSQRSVGSELFVAVRRELAAAHGLRDWQGNAVTAASNTALPNIVLLLADDISYDQFGFSGNAAARTPTLDEIARQGTLFSAGQVPSAFCRPSLATLLTGAWPHQVRIHANNGVVSLPPGYTTLATLLRQRGYATFAGGKFWEDEPEWRGFDGFDTDKNRFAREGQDKLWQFIAQRAGQQPLFIWWAPMLPHRPHNPPPALLDAINPDAIVVPPSLPADKHAAYREQTRTLLAMNLWLDNSIRELRDQLAARGQLDNTLFIFLSDNGFSPRGVSKSSPYQLGLQTPLIFSWPGHIAPQRIATPTASLHVYNTILDYAGVSLLPKDRPQPGHSLRPVLEQRAPATPEPLFGASYQAVTMKTDQTPRPERDIYALQLRDGDWKYILYLRELREENNADLTIQPGLQPFPARDAGDEELYDLSADGYEEVNLAGEPQQADKLAAYRRQVLDWWANSGGQPLDALAGCPAQPAALCRKIAAVRP